MLKVQKLYTEVRSETRTEFHDALAEIGIDVRDYPEHGFMHLDYNMIECDKTNPIVIECRGLIMDYDGNILCKSFDRFFNLGENGVFKFDFANSTVYEKADGSLVRVYFNTQTNKWEIATRGTAFAEGSHEWYGTFRGYILHCMGRTEEEFQFDCEKHLNKKVTYIFEAIGPSNRIVTKYNYDQLVLLSAINKETNEEYFATPDTAEWLKDVVGWNVRLIKSYSFNTQEECLDTLGDLPDLAEGYVVYNRLTGARIKIKSPAYVAAHRLRGNGLSVNAICELIMIGEVDEYLAVFESDTEKFDDALYEYNFMTTNLVADYELYKGIESQKDFAMAIKDVPHNSVLFKARKDKCDVLHAFNSIPVNKRAEWLKAALTK